MLPCYMLPDVNVAGLNVAAGVNEAGPDGPSRQQQWNFHIWRVGKETQRDLAV